MKKVLIVPRWAATPADDWYPWLQQQLLAEPGRYEVQVLEVPNWDVPDVTQSVNFLRRYLPPEQLDADTLLIGHSVGCQLLIRYLAQVAADARRARQPVPQVGGVVCVAGWFSVDKPWETIRNWIHLPVNYAGARQTIPAGRLVVLLSNDDPYTADYRENERLWVRKMGARVHILSEKQHFGETLDADVLAVIRELANKPPAT